VLALIAALLCVVANAFFVAAEFALARVRPTEVEALARTGDRQAGRTLQISRQLDTYLTATQLGITLASLGLGWLGEPALAHLIETPLVSAGFSQAAVHGAALVIAFAIISMLHIVVGELVPKSLAIMQPLTVARLTSRPMTAFFYLMYPVIYPLNAFSLYLLRRAGLQPGEQISGGLSAEEIRLIVRESFKDEAKDGTKRDLLERVLMATDRPVRALMVPRVDMVTLSLTADIDRWLDTIRQSGFSRYPVSENGDPDKIVGYIYAKDLLLSAAPPKRGLRSLKRDLLFVPESSTVGDLLARFRLTRIPIAVVVDEYGGTSGLVTVKDLVDELVGDLRDELGTDEQQLVERDDGLLVADGSLPITDLPLEGFGEQADCSCDTLGGYIISQLGRLARPGDHVRVGEFEATVEDVRSRRIGRVVLRRSKQSEPPPSPNGGENENPG
jgi:CBS domain containing-hemolysin-like protein